MRLGHPSWGKRVSEDAEEKDRVNRCTEESIEGERGAEREMAEFMGKCRSKHQEVTWILEGAPQLLSLW